MVTGTIQQLAADLLPRRTYSICGAVGGGVVREGAKMFYSSTLSLTCTCVTARVPHLVVGLVALTEAAQPGLGSRHSHVWCAFAKPKMYVVADISFLKVAIYLLTGTKDRNPHIEIQS